jgi:hypothetical protein
MRSDDVLARAEAALRRHGGQSRLQTRALERVARAGIVKAKRLAWLTAGFLFGVPLWAIFVSPLGISGILLAAMAYAGLTLAALLTPAGVRVPTETALPTTALAQLPLSTEAWLASQRRLLPPPAQRLADGIGLRLEQLAPQLAKLDEKDPAAFEVRRLIADELPELVKGYGRVPAHLRREGMNGMSPDKQLVEGLAVVDSELERMSTQLATGDLKALATQGRYLELKYLGDPS